MVDTQEAYTQYEKALKIGKKEVAKNRFKRKNPYLPALDDIIDGFGLDIQKLGVIDVPSKLIVGTKNSGRTVSFSSNFMPLLRPDSEFGAKWMRLCGYHLSDEGITDPLKVYEYLGKFYVEEGNKRASVLKFFGAVYIPCDVIRILPKNDGSYESDLYYEFLKFNKLSNLYSIQFKKQGYYKKLQLFLFDDEEHVWERRERIRIIGIYERLANMLKRKKIEASIADSLLIMIEIFGYDRLCEMSDKELSQAVEENKYKMIFDKAEYSILCVSDEEDESLWNGYNVSTLKKYDFILSSGDLKTSYLEYLVTMANKPLLYVHGNHDSANPNNEPEGCICVDDDLYILNGIRILGLGGCYRYRKDDKNMYTEKEIERRIKKLRKKIKKAGGVDIILTHAPAKGYGDLEDYAHQGFESFVKLIEEYKPKYLIFGHVHPRYQVGYSKEYELNGTKLLNACSKIVIKY